MNCQILSYIYLIQPNVNITAGAHHANVRDDSVRTSSGNDVETLTGRGGAQTTHPGFIFETIHPDVSCSL